MGYEYDAVVVGSGPNGLAAAITLAKQGLKVLILEGQEQPGGGMRSAQITLPGFVHDLCSAVHPMALASPFFRALSLERLGVEWVHPTYPLAHPLDGKEAVLLQRSVRATADSLGVDASPYFQLMQTLVHKWPYIDQEVLGPLALPRRPFSLAWFGLRALWPARAFLHYHFRNPHTRALLGGIAAHSILPLEWMPSMAVALVLGGAAHGFGWPMPKGGSQALVEALLLLFGQLGGQLQCGHWVRSWQDIPPARLTLLDLHPQQFLKLAGPRLPWWYSTQLKAFCPSPGVFKIDYALSDPVPWSHPELAQAGTLHLGGQLEELALAERQVWRNQIPQRPYVLVSQPSLFDPSRAPQGRHVLWAYCHVPPGCNQDMTQQIEQQIERFAPGFRQVVLQRHCHNPAALEAYNPNYPKGDITGGAMLLHQLFTRPSLSLNPYATPLKGVYLCSASTPPGAGVHGMCGYWAALAAFRSLA